MEIRGREGLCPCNSRTLNSRRATAGCGRRAIDSARQRVKAFTDSQPGHPARIHGDFMIRFAVTTLSVLWLFTAGVGAVPFGGDDSGQMPPDAPKGPIAKCQNAVGKA